MRKNNTDTNYIFLSKYYFDRFLVGLSSKLIEQFLKEDSKYSSITKHILSCIWDLIFSKKSYNELSENKIWIFIDSKNQYEALNFLHDNLKKSIFIGSYTQKIGFGKKYMMRLSSKILYVRSLLLSIYKLNKSGYDVFKYMYFILLTHGMYEAWLDILKNYKPSCIIISNAHIPRGYFLIKAAKQLGIKTIFFQHGQLSYSLASQSDCDYSLLYGRYSYDCLNHIGAIRGKVDFVGIPKLDKYLSLSKNKKQENKIVVGLSLSFFDDTKKVIEVVTYLSSKNPEISIIIRDHPRLNRMPLIKKQLPSNNSVSFSDSKSESTGTYLLTLDIHIAGITSTHIEAAVMGVSTVQFLFTDTKATLPDDYYRFEKNNLVLVKKTKESLSEFLHEYSLNPEQQFMDEDVVKYYADTYKTDFHGYSKKLAINLVKDFLKNADG